MNIVEGLDKEGIFRRSANAKVLREVQEELNRGNDDLVC